MARSSDQRLASVLGAVAALDPVDEREERSIERLLSEVQRLEFPFDEDADPVYRIAMPSIEEQIKRLKKIL